MEPAQEGLVEDWVALTQSTLGSLISKPRMLPDRLRKPPFRFLFDVIVEVARQTGFGLNEVFGGELGEKPQMPNSREEKVEFLDRWIQASAVAMGEYGPWMAHVSAQNIVCGIAPEWTNFLLQCTAAIGWPQSCSLPAPPSVALEAAQEQQVESQAPVAADEAAAQQPLEQPDPQPLPAAEQQAATEEEQEQQQQQQQPESLQPTAPTPSPEVTEWTLEPMHLPPAADPGVDLDADYQKLAQAQQEFQATANAWQQFNAKKAAAAATPEDDEEDDSDDSDDSDEEPLPPPPSETLGASAERPGTSALRKAAETTSKVNEELRRVQEMLDEMEEGLDRDEEAIQRRRHQAEEHKAQLLAKKEQEMEAERLRLEQQQREEQMSLEERQLAYEQEKERRRLKKEEKRRKKAEKKAAEEKARAVYPVSKTAASQGVRMVAAFGDDEYAEDFHEPEEAEPAGPAAPEVHVFGTDGGENLNEGGGYVDSMSGCFTDALLGDGPEKPKEGFDAEAAEAAFYASHAKGAGPGSAGGPGCSLFDRLKVEMRDTYISFLTASLPDILLRKYDAIELIRCLQILLEELRKCLAAHNLEDVKDEEPTSLAETLKEASPDCWLEELQSTPAYTLKNKHDLPELIDTLQGIAGACSDRLSDELGPLSQWCDKDSPLRFIPDIPVLEEEETPLNDNKAATWGSDLHGFSGGDSLDQHQHHQEQQEQHLQQHQHQHEHKTFDHSALASSASRLVEPSWREDVSQSSPTRSPVSSRPEHSPLHSPSPAAAPAFSAALGPALWEQEAMGLPRTAGPATAKTGRVATGLGTSGPRPPLMSSTGVGWSSSHGR